MFAIETRYLSIEIERPYYRIGRFSLYIMESTYRPLGLFEIGTKESGLSSEGFCTVFIRGYQIEVSKRAKCQHFFA